MRGPAVCDAAPLRLHNGLDEVESKAVTRHIGLDIPSSIESFKQLPLIGAVDAGPMVRDGEADFVRCRILSSRNLDQRFTVAFAVLDRVAQEILNALR